MRTRPPIALAALAALVAVGLATSSAPALARTVHSNDPNADKIKYGKHDKKKDNDKKDNDLVGPFKKKDYPLAARLRPLVLPNQMGQFGVDFDATKVPGVPTVTTTGTGTNTNTNTTTTSATALAFNVNFDYGIGNHFDFGASTGLLLSPDTAWDRGFQLRAHYLSYDSKKLDFAPGILVPLSFVSQAPFGVTVDLPCRELLNNGLFLYFGQGAVPIGLSPGFSLSAVGNGGIGYQVTPPVELFLDTTLVTITLAPDGNFTGIWDALAFNLGGQYSPGNAWDIGAKLHGTNVWSVQNSFLWSIGLFVNYRF